MRVVGWVIGGLFLLVAVALGDWMIWNSLSLRESGPWWRYTLMGADFAEDLISISAAGVFGLMFLAAVVGWTYLMLSRRGETGMRWLVYEVLLGCLGFAVVRGIVQHWSWWIIRWDKADVFKDFVCGTVWFGCIGFMAGFCLAMTVLAATALICLPVLFVVRRLVYGRNPPPLSWNGKTVA